MEISQSPPPPPPTTTTTAAVKTLDPDPRIPKHLPPPFTNGVLKRHKPRHHHNHNHHHPTPVVITYRECLKNHAATIGGHAVDGCGEFMPSSTSTPTDPTSLKCAACGCHRNFHRRDPDESSFPTNPPPQHVIEYQPHHRHHPPPPPPPISLAGSPPDSPSPPPISSSYYPSAPHMLLALSAGVSAPTPENHHHPITPGAAAVAGKKRFRTKFTQDQKEKMQELAERVGWKMQKRDEDLIIGFCNEIGVEKGVFKVWMHNNKMNLGSKKDQNDNVSYGGGGGGGGGIDFLRNNDNNHQNDNVSYGGGGGGNVIGTNGSSSSS